VKVKNTKPKESAESKRLACILELRQLYKIETDKNERMAILQAIKILKKNDEFEKKLFNQQIEK
jgi:hypothetical protein